ncbi:uncharacterized protein LOC123267196 isoform X2 [Cotesia glomerata]|uniref:uncharacterized protein LOC123267196 isoform X2 n=1 Tax=Cotesia glomerata TaxID=32391 RepID=UPI001D030594|nr:uncharacterized protein LOC123267196 isoform X2 [Cotesia glomerata]
MSKVTHAYVCYLDDNEKLIVKVSDIKAFKPENVEDFDNTKKYQVLWYDKATKKSNYYSASIILLGSSKKNLEEKIKQAEDDDNSTKLRQTRISSSESDRSSDDEKPLKKRKKDDSLKSNKSTLKLSKVDTSTPNISLEFSSKKTVVDEIYEQIYELKNRVVSLENENTIILSDVSILKEELNKVKQDSIKNNHRNDGYSRKQSVLGNNEKIENDLMVLPEDPRYNKTLGLYETSTPDLTEYNTPANIIYN